MRSARLMAVALAACCVTAAAARDGDQGGRGTTPPPKAPGVMFEDISRTAGVEFRHSNGATPEKRMVETMGSGGAFLDFDNDGWLDLFLVDGGAAGPASPAAGIRHRLFRNRGDGTFEDVSKASGIAHQGFGMGACAADYDNDGWIDLYVTSDGPNLLYRNTGSGRFTDVTGTARVGDTTLSTSCAFADIDIDGDLDLFVTNYVDLTAGEKYCGDSRVRAYCRPDVYRGLPNTLYRNDGDGTFTDITRQAGMHTTAGKGLGVVFADYDDDGLPDVFVANDLVPNFLFHNEGKGVFRETALLAGVAVASDARARAGMGTDAGDWDGDGRLDLVVTNFELESHNLYRNMGEGLFADATLHSGLGVATLPFLGFGVAFLDFDNDGRLDVAIANGHVLDNPEHFRANARYAQRNLLLWNDGRRLRDVGQESGAGFALERVSRGLAAGDIDNDGDLDLLITNNGDSAALLRNDGGNRQASLIVRLQGRRANRQGVGARVRAIVAGQSIVREAKAGSSYLSQGDARLHFGLGQAAGVDRLEVRWPGGRTDVVERVAANAIVTIVEGEGLTVRTPFARGR